MTIDAPVIPLVEDRIWSVYTEPGFMCETGGGKHMLVSNIEYKTLDKYRVEYCNDRGYIINKECLKEGEVVIAQTEHLYLIEETE